MWRVLFLCTGNSCRSQMAEAWTKHLWGSQVEAHSAGIVAHGLNPFAVQVMDEVGLNMRSQSSKTVSDLGDLEFDLVITVCGHADENCPARLAKGRVFHVAFDDPPKLAKTAATPAEGLVHYRRVRDEIRAFVQDDLIPLLHR